MEREEGNAAVAFTVPTCGYDGNSRRYVWIVTNKQ